MIAQNTHIIFRPNSESGFPVAPSSENTPENILAIILDSPRVLKWPHIHIPCNIIYHRIYATYWDFLKNRFISSHDYFYCLTLLQHIIILSSSSFIETLMTSFMSALTRRLCLKHLSITQRPHLVFSILTDEHYFPWDDNSLFAMLFISPHAT